MLIFRSERRLRRSHPGQRRTDRHIMARATLYSALAVFVGAASGALGMLHWHGGGAAASVAIGAGVVVLSNLFQWGSTLAVQRWLSQFQGVAFAGVFLFKLAALMAVLAALLPLPWLSAQAFFGAFALAVLLSLAVSSAVVMRDTMLTHLP